MPRNCCDKPDVFCDLSWRGAHREQFGICTSCAQIVLVNFKRRRYVPLSYLALRRLMKTKPQMFRDLQVDQRHIRQYTMPRVRTRREMPLKLLPLKIYLTWMKRDRVEAN